MGLLPETLFKAQRDNKLIQSLFYDASSFRCTAITVSKRNVYSPLFCFPLLGLHEEKGHVTHKESKKQGGKSSRKVSDNVHNLQWKKASSRLTLIPRELEVWLELWNFGIVIVWNKNWTLVMYQNSNERIYFKLLGINIIILFVHALIVHALKTPGLALCHCKHDTLQFIQLRLNEFRIFEVSKWSWRKHEHYLQGDINYMV